MHVSFPYRLGTDGRTASTDQAAYVRDLIEQVLFTSPGERVNRPDFGSGVMQLIFAPNSDALAGATQATIQAALMKWVGELIELRGVEVEAVDATLSITISYALRSTGEVRVDQFTRSV